MERRENIYALGNFKNRGHATLGGQPIAEFEKMVVQAFAALMFFVEIIAITGAGFFFLRGQ